MIRIVGLGPRNLDRISVGAYRVICAAPTVFVRTARHPAVEELAAEGIKFDSFDRIYELSGSFEEVYACIAETILAAEKEHGDVVYAVPGHPLCGESAVRILVAEAAKQDRDFEIIGAESFIEASLEAMNLSLDEGIKIVDALSMDRVSVDPDLGNLIYQVYDRSIASDVKLKLMETYPDEFEVTIVNGGAAPGEQAITIPLYMLDRHEVDHLSSVYVPALGNNSD